MVTGAPTRTHSHMAQRHRNSLYTVNNVQLWHIHSLGTLLGMPLVIYAIIQSVKHFSHNEEKKGFGVLVYVVCLLG